MKRGKLLPLKKSENASATVEFAVVLPLLLTFIFGMVEFGRIMSVYQILTTSAREGARIAALPGATNSVVEVAVQDALNEAGLSYDALEFLPADVASADRDEPVTVIVRVNYENISWVSGFFSSLQGEVLQGRSVMRKEGFG